MTRDGARTDRMLVLACSRRKRLDEGGLLQHALDAGVQSRERLLELVLGAPPGLYGDVEPDQLAVPLDRKRLRLLEVARRSIPEFPDPHMLHDFVLIFVYTCDHIIPTPIRRTATTDRAEV
jgi:hypothetical protein